jgi:hypothetical protein
MRIQHPYMKIGGHLPRAHQRMPPRLVVGRHETERPSYDVLVDRLITLYGWPNDNPRGAPFKKVTLTELLLHKPRGSRERSQGFRAHPGLLNWHIGRVRFFYDEIKAGRPLDPISISDAKILVDQGYQYVKPLILDGHHRLAASEMAGVRCIPAHFAGREELRDYLTGQRDRRPG